MGAFVLAEAKVKISYDDLKKLDLKIDESGRKFTEQTNKMSTGLKALTGIIAGIGVVKFGNDIFQASLKMDNMNKMLLANEGSQKKANEAMAKYLQMAKMPGLNLTQIVQTATQFKALGVSVAQTDKTILALANTMVLSGRGAEEFGRVSVQFQQMIGKGKLMAEDLRVIAESMPMIRKLMINAFGTADTDELAKSGLTASEFIAKITTEMEKLPKGIGGAQNSIDNFKDSLLQFEAAIGKNVLPAIGNILDKMTGMMDGFQKLSDPMKGLIGNFALGGVGILGIAFALKTVGIELGAVVGAMAKNPLLMAAILGYAGGASISNLIPIPGLDIEKGVTNMPRSERDIAIRKILEKQQTEISYQKDDYVNANTLSAIKKAGYDIPLDSKVEDLLSAMKIGMGTFVEKQMNLSTAVGDLVKEQIKMTEDLIKARASIEFLMEPYGYSTQEGKYKSVFTPKITPASNKSSLSYWMDQFYPGGVSMSEPITGVPFGRSNVIPYGGPNQSQLSRDFSVSGATGYDVGKWQEVQDIIEKAGADWYDEFDSMSNTWDDFFSKHKEKVKDMGMIWASSMNKWIGIAEGANDIFMKLLDKMGMGVDKTTKGHISGMLSGAASGAAIGTTILPGWGTAIGAGLGAIAGYDKGGWVDKPSIIRVAETEPELIIPRSKLGSSGMGSNIGTINIIVPDTWDAKKVENMVVYGINNAIRAGRL